MKKILMIASDNNMASGAFRSMAQMCEILNEGGDYKITVVLPKKGDGVSLLKEKNIEYLMVRSYSWIVEIAKKEKVLTKILMMIKTALNHISIYRICRIIESREIDIVHINTIWSYVGAKAALIKKKKLVWHIREAVEPQNRCLYKEKYYSLINRADRIICISDYIRNYYSGKIKKDKVSVIYNGIDADYYFIADRDILSGDTLNILNIGNMNSNKRQEDIIAAAKKLVDNGFSNFRISFVGEGIKEEAFKKMCCELGLEDIITFYGNQKDIIKFYKNNDVIITSGDYEAFGRTTIEGMMAGCLVIGNNTGATSILLNDNRYGLLYNASDDSDLYNKIMQVLTGNRSEIIKIAKAGQEYAISHYSAENNAHEVSKIYEQIK